MFQWGARRAGHNTHQKHGTSPAALGTVTVSLTLPVLKVWLKIRISALSYFTLHKSEYAQVLKIHSATLTQVTEKLAALQQL